MSLQIADTPNHRLSIDQLPEEQAQLFLEGIRMRRMAASIKYQEVKRAKTEARAETVSVQLVKQLELLRKQIEKLDTAMDSVEARVNKCRALRLELEP